MNLEPIDTSTTAGKARVMQLAAEGRKVACRSRVIGGDFSLHSKPGWDWVLYESAAALSEYVDANRSAK